MACSKQTFGTGRKTIFPQVASFALRNKLTANVQLCLLTPHVFPSLLHMNEKKNFNHKLSFRIIDNSSVVFHLSFIVLLFSPMLS